MDGVILDAGHWEKIEGFGTNTKSKSSFRQYFLSKFTYEPVLFLILIVLYAEFDILLIDIKFSLGHCNDKTMERVDVTIMFIDKLEGTAYRYPQ